VDDQPAGDAGGLPSPIYTPPDYYDNHNDCCTKRHHHERRTRYATEVLEKIKDRLTPEELAEVNNIVSKSIVALGTDEAFALRDSEGEIRAFKQKVRLTAADGTLTQPVPGGPFVVSAQGYEILARVPAPAASSR